MGIRSKQVGCFTLSLLALAVSQAVHAAEEVQSMDEVVVSGVREAERKAETPATVGSIKGRALREARATHPSEVMRRVPGVWVNITGGEGHQTAIRQPLSTAPSYAYLEDGVPTRSTGFFNHNALYEINIPQSDGIEVTKGPGSALYGSDAIGGVINVLTRRPPTSREIEAGLDLGSFGWKRLLLSGGNTLDDNAFRADLNLTKTDGWRQATGYTRQSGTLRWDRALDESAMLKVVGTFSNIDQQTAGSSTISEADYLTNPTTSYTPISFRKVKAMRLSAAYDKEMGNSLLSITPYVRDDSMDLLANWSLGYDPTVYNTSNKSFGVMTKYRTDFEPYRARLIVGLDLDHSPGSRLENSITATKVGSVYTSYVTGQTLYDYKVTYQGVSPYLHGELSPVSRLRITAGARYDNMSYDFQNNLAPTAISTLPTRWYGQSANTGRSFSHLSPKLGATYEFSENLNGFAAYNNSFRAPSEGQLFRPATAASALAAQAAVNGNLNLRPIEVASYELGLRGKTGGVTYEVSYYQMRKVNDILNQKDPLTLATVAVNNGTTMHKGVELGVGVPLAETLKLDFSYSNAKHTYESWVTSAANFTGNEMMAAPQTIANTRLTYSPGFLQGGNMALEVVSLGSYWMDDANTRKYKGHDLFNLAVNYRVAPEMVLIAKVNNVTDARFAESTAIAGGAPVYAPGLPRTMYVGLQNTWK